MHHGRRRFAGGLAVIAFAAIGWSVARPATASTGSSAVARPAPVSAAINPDGTSIGADPAWMVGKPDPGQYLIAFGRDVRVEVQSWDQAADVTVIPMSAQSWLVSFAHDGQPVDTAFTFVAVPTSR